MGKRYDLSTGRVMTSADGMISPRSRRAIAAFTSSMRLRPSASIAKNENPSGTGAGTGLPAFSSFCAVASRVARSSSALRAAVRKRAPVGARSASDSGSSTRSGSGSTRSRRVSMNASPYVTPGALRRANASRIASARSAFASGRKASTTLVIPAGIGRRPTGWRFWRSPPSSTSSCAPSSVGRAVRATSWRSWSSVSAQKTGTAGTPRRERARARWMASNALTIS